MEKKSGIMAKILIKAAKNTAVSSVNQSCAWFTHQPVEPMGLKKYKKVTKK